MHYVGLMENKQNLQVGNCLNVYEEDIQHVTSVQNVRHGVIEKRSRVSWSSDFATNRLLSYLNRYKKSAYYNFGFKELDIIL